MASKHQSATIKKLQSEGWFVINLINVLPKGLPDLLALKDGKAMFIECKEATDTLKPLQEFRIKQLKQMGFEAYVSKKEK